MRKQFSFEVEPDRSDSFRALLRIWGSDRRPSNSHFGINGRLVSDGRTLDLHTISLSAGDDEPDQNDKRTVFEFAITAARMLGATAIKAKIETPDLIPAAIKVFGIDSLTELGTYMPLPIDPQSAQIDYLVFQSETEQ